MRDQKILLLAALLTFTAHTAAAADLETRVFAPQGLLDSSMLPVYGAWSFGENNLLVYQENDSTFYYAVAPSTFEQDGSLAFDPENRLDPKGDIKQYKDDKIEVYLTPEGTVESVVVSDGKVWAVAEPFAAAKGSGFVFSNRKLPPFTVVPAVRPRNFCGTSGGPVYLYSEWVGSCLHDVWGCPAPLQNQVRSIACCFGVPPFPECKSFGL